MKTNWGLWVSAIVAATLFWGLFGPSNLVEAASYGNIGSQVAVSDSDWRPTVYNGSNDYMARTSSGSWTDTQSFYMYAGASPSSTTLQAGAVKVCCASFGSYSTADSSVSWTNPDGTAPALSSDFSNQVRYLEMDGKMGYTAGDVVYYDAPSGASGCSGVGTLSVCDIRLVTVSVNGTTYTAGTRVVTGDADLVEASDLDGFYPDSTTFLGTFSLYYFDKNGNYVIDTDDYVYLRNDAAAGTPGQKGAYVPMVGDVRLTASNCCSAATKVAKGDADTVPTLENQFNLNCVALVTGSTSGVETDDLFLVWDSDCTGNPATIMLNDLALGGGDCTGGTTIASTSSCSSDKGYGATIQGKTNFTSAVFFIDQDSNGYTSSGDPVYWNRPTASPFNSADGTAGKVTQGDLRLSSVTVSGTTYGAGTIVKSGDKDVTGFSSLTGTIGFNLKYFNATLGKPVVLQSLSNAKVTGANGTFEQGNSTEGVYISSNDIVDNGDIRLYNVTLGLGSALVTIGGCTDSGAAAECNSTLQTASNIRVTGPDGTFTSGYESVYVSADSYVNNPDLRLTNLTAAKSPDGSTTYSANLTVANTDVDVVSATPWDSTDQIYLGRNMTDNISVPQRLDVKIGANFGDRISTSSSEFIPTLANITANLRLARFDNNETGNFVDDVFYASTATSTSFVDGDARLLKYDDTRKAGTQTKSGDPDFTQTISTACASGSFLAGCIGFINNVGSSQFGKGDIVYVETNSIGGNPGASTFSQFDIRMTDFTYGGTDYKAGTYVRNGDGDLNAFTGNAGAAPQCRYWAFKFWDDNGNGKYDWGDQLYLTADVSGSGCPLANASFVPRVFDIHASGTGSTTTTTSSSSSSSSTTTTTSSSSTTTTTTTTTSSNATTNTTTSHTTGANTTTSETKTTTKPTPALGGALLVASLAILAAAVRRRRS